MRIHRHQQRTEALDAEAPDALGVEVVHVDLLDRLDPGGLQRRGAADHGEIGAADVAEGVERALPHAALADDDADALALHQRPGEALHALRGGGADAHRLIAGRAFVGDRHLAHVRRGVDHGVALHVEDGFAVAVEHRDQVGVADAEQRFSSVTVSPTFSARTCASVTGVSRMWWVMRP